MKLAPVALHRPTSAALKREKAIKTKKTRSGDTAAVEPGGRDSAISGASNPKL